MRNITSILKSKRFIAAAVLTAVTVGVIVIQRKAPKVEVLVEDPADS